MGNFFTEEQENEIKRLAREGYLERVRAENLRAFEDDANSPLAEAKPKAIYFRKIED